MEFELGEVETRMMYMHLFDNRISQVRISLTKKAAVEFADHDDWQKRRRS